MVELPVRRLRENAVVPARAYAGDAGMDLSSCERVELAPGERALVPTGLAVAIPEVELVEVDELPDSERGVRGFGSSAH